MSDLIKLYIRSVLTGFGLAAFFVAALLWLNVANLGHLVLTSDIGYIALLLLWVFNGIVFAGVQFGWAIMQLARPEPPTGGRRHALRLRAGAATAIDRRNAPTPRGPSPIQKMLTKY